MLCLKYKYIENVNKKKNRLLLSNFIKEKLLKIFFNSTMQTL
jgi:hypothetical protein